MKKFLLTAALVLALVTSLTAGTMAYYTASVDKNATISAKDFSFTVDDYSNLFTTGVSIAPGDKAVYTFKVHNENEVVTKATVSAELEDKFPGMTVKIERLVNDKNGEAVSDETGASKDKATVVTTMSTQSIDSYKVTVSWAYGTLNDATTSYAGEEATLKLSMLGEQQNANATFGDTGI